MSAQRTKVRTRKQPEKFLGEATPSCPTPPVRTWSGSQRSLPRRGWRAARASLLLTGLRGRFMGEHFLRAALAQEQMMSLSGEDRVALALCCCSVTEHVWAWSLGATLDQ